MESAILEVVLDSSVLIAAERGKHTLAQVIENVATASGTVPIILLVECFSCKPDVRS